MAHFEMKVYKVSTLATPRNGRFPNYCTLNVNRNDDQVVRNKFFLGRPYPKQWSMIELFIDNPKYPRPDFYGFGVVNFVCSSKAYEFAGETLEMSGELLPVSVEDEPGEFFIYNVTNCINVIDKKKSVWRALDKAGTYKELQTMVFHPERFGEETIFKIPEDGGVGIYCLERSGDPDDGEFKALVENHELLGLSFDLVWSD